MDTPKRQISGRLRIALWAIPLWLAGSMAMTPVSVVRPAVDSKGEQVYSEDGRRQWETDYLGSFMTNWVGYTLISTGIGVMIYGVGGWIFQGLQTKIRWKQGARS